MSSLLASCTIVGGFTEDPVLGSTSGSSTTDATAASGASSSTGSSGATSSSSSSSASAGGDGGAAGATSTSNAGGSNAGGSNAGGEGGSGGDGGATSSSGGGDGGGGAGGEGGSTPLGSWPDSETPFCSDGGAEIDCADVPAPYNAQDGNIVAPAPSFDFNGEVATDLVTGLVWTKDPAPTPRNHGDAVAYCAGLRTAGLMWRLPLARELASLWDAGVRDQALAEEFGWYEGEARYWADIFGSPKPFVNFSVTQVGLGSGGNARAVRCVEALDPKQSDWVLEEETAMDRSTGLVWQRSDRAVQTTWREGLEACFDLAMLEGQGWRLPTVKEVATIVFVTLDERIASEVAIGEGPYWTGTPQANNAARAYVLYGEGTGKTGNVEGVLIAETVAAVRCVRDLNAQ